MFLGGEIPLLRGSSSVLWQVDAFRTGMILTAYVACLLDNVCSARKDKKTYGHTYCSWTCVCALSSSKRSCESAESLGKVNLAVADSSKLITAGELWSVSK